MSIKKFSLIIICAFLPHFIHGMNPREPYKKQRVIQQKYIIPSQTKPTYTDSVPTAIEARYKSESVFDSIVRESLQDCGVDLREKNNLDNFDTQIRSINDILYHDAYCYGKNLCNQYKGDDVTVIKQMLAHTIIDVAKQQSVLDTLEQQHKLMLQELASAQETSRHLRALTIVGCLTVGFFICKETETKLEI